MVDTEVKELLGIEADITFAAKLAGACIVASYNGKNALAIKNWFSTDSG